MEFDGGTAAQRRPGPRPQGRHRLESAGGPGWRANEGILRAARGVRLRGLPRGLQEGARTKFSPHWPGLGPKRESILSFAPAKDDDDALAQSWASLRLGSGDS